MPLCLGDQRNVVLRHDVFGKFRQRLRSRRPNPDMELVSGKRRRRIKVNMEVDLVAAKPKFDLVAAVIFRNRAVTASHARIGSKTIQFNWPINGGVCPNSLRDCAVCYQDTAESSRHLDPLETKKGPATMPSLYSPCGLSSTPKLQVRDLNPHRQGYGPRPSTYPPASLAYMVAENYVNPEIKTASQHLVVPPAP